MTDRMDRSFLARDPLQVAPDLLGCVIEHGQVRIRLTEVEAYAGTADPGSHAYRGPTPRTQVMFGPPGHLYVYFSYGVHWCVNVVCGNSGMASAVLLRAGEVVAGKETATRRRQGERTRTVPERDLARGPARLAQTLGLNGGHDGMDVCSPAAPVRLLRGSTVGKTQILTGPRVGVSGPGGDGETYPWRFWLADEPSVSAYRPGARRPRKPGQITQ